MSSPTTTSSPRPESRPRNSSLTSSIFNARPPPGVLAATGHAIGTGPSLSDLRQGSSTRRFSAGLVTSPPPIDEHGTAYSPHEPESDGKKGGWLIALRNGGKAFWGYFTTPLGFFVTIYMLNVVAWGGMLFLLLCGAAPAMCHPSCNHDFSPRSIWIEIDSQILNALFCVTGFGLVPWRFRDLYFLLQWRLLGNRDAYLRLSQIHSSWFRPPPESSAETVGSELNLPEPVTGERAGPTKKWKLDYVVWGYVWNTFFQCGLCGFMWGMDRFERPPWCTGLFVALACGVAGAAGGMVWWEGRKVKKVEGKGDVEAGAGSQESSEVEKVVSKEESERGQEVQ